MVRCLFIHLKFRHWSLNGSTFAAQAPQFSWTTQCPSGYCSACVDTRRGAISYSGWEIIEHPPNNPDLAPSDSSPNKKKHFRAKRFKSHADVKHEVQTWLHGQNPAFYRQGFEKWISCLDKCLNREGDCVGK